MARRIVDLSVPLQNAPMENNPAVLPGNKVLGQSF